MSANTRHTSLLWISLAATMAMVLWVLLRWTLTTGLQCDELLFLKAIEMGPIYGLTSEGSSHPPLFRWIVGAFLTSAAPDWLLRTPSLLASLLTVVVWFFILRRMIDDDRLVAMMLPLIACGSSWLEIGYQLTPYAFLTLICSTHFLCWLRLLETNDFRNRTWFVLSGAASIWTHFYGINLLLVDQIIWLLLICKNREWWRAWLTTSLASGILVLPVIPIALYYAVLIKPYPLVQFDNFPAYFVTASQVLFSEVTFNLGFARPLIMVWYLIVGVTLAQWFAPRGSSTSTGDSPDQSHGQRQQILVLSVFFLAGFPAMQLHSHLGDKAMWTRYAMIATWVHWPILLLWIRRIGGRRMARLATATSLAWCAFAFFGINQMRQPWTFDHQHSISVLSKYAEPEDAFFAQDMDLWIGEFNFDRLWFERYSPVTMTIVTDRPMGRFELAEQGLSFTTIPAEIQRVWVCSDLYSPEALRQMQTDDWKLLMLDESVPLRPIAIFTKVGKPELVAGYRHLGKH